MTRRTFLATSTSAAVLAAKPASGLKICIFSKHFQWTDLKETAEIAKQVGFDGVDITLRGGGHVLPARVKDDLPKAVEIIRKVGLDVPMFTSAILNASTPYAADMLKTASSLGIRHYRWGGLRYDNKRTPQEQLEALKPAVKDLAALNKEYNICGMYHTHSGFAELGASIWDLWYLLKDLDPRYIGVNYDVGHATVEGGFGGWISTTRATATPTNPMMRGIALKDFKWGTDAKGQWRPQWCGMGQGMVDFRKFFSLLRESAFDGPVQLHFEYPELGGADTGKTSMSITKDKFISILRRDLEFTRRLMQQAGLV